MNFTSIIDVILLLFILGWGAVGFNRGVIKQGVKTLGTILMFIIAFYLKNPLAEFLSLHLPFFNFGGILLGATAVNILFYQVIAFIIVICLLEIILNALEKASGIIEKILRFTIILGIPSKILGFVLGIVEGVIVAHILVFFAAQPIFKLDFSKAELANNIMKVPGLTNVTGTIMETFTDVYDLMDKYAGTSDSNGYNLEAIEVMLKHKVISVEYVEKLIEKGKIEVRGIEEVLNRYRGA